MHAKLLEEWLAGIQHCYLLLWLLIVTFSLSTYWQYLHSTKILHALSNLKGLWWYENISTVFDVSPFEKWKLIPFPLSVGRTSYLLLWIESAEGGSGLPLETVMRSIAACPCLLDHSLWEASLWQSEQRSMQGLWPQSSLQVTVAPVNTPTVAWWSRTT